MYPPIDDLLIHRDNMLMLDCVTDDGEDILRAAAKVDPQAWYADEHGAMPAWIGIELMAQAIAAHVGLSAHARNEKPRPGLLLGTRSYVAHVPAFAPGEALQVCAQQVFREDNGLAAFVCTIERDGHRLADATLKVFEPSDFATFMEQQK